MIHRNKLFNKSVKNKDRYIPEGYNRRILDTLDSLPDTQSEDKNNVCIVKHDRAHGYMTALSAAAVIVLVMGSVYVYTNIASGGSDDSDDDPQITVTTATTDESEKNDYSTTSHQNDTTTTVSEKTVSSDKSIRDHDIAGNTDINAVQAQETVNKQTTSAYNKKETEKATQKTAVKTTTKEVTKAKSETVAKETKKTENKTTVKTPEKTEPEKTKPVVTEPPVVTPPDVPIPPVHTNRGNEKPDKDHHENNKDIVPFEKYNENEFSQKKNDKIEEGVDKEQNFQSFEDVKEEMDNEEMYWYEARVTSMTRPLF